MEPGATTQRCQGKYWEDFLHPCIIIVCMASFPALRNTSDWWWDNTIHSYCMVYMTSFPAALNDHASFPHSLTHQCMYVWSHQLLQGCGKSSQYFPWYLCVVTPRRGKLILILSSRKGSHAHPRALYREEGVFTSICTVNSTKPPQIANKAFFLNTADVGHRNKNA